MTVVVGGVGEGQRAGNGGLWFQDVVAGMDGLVLGKRLLLLCLQVQRLRIDIKAAKEVISDAIVR
jgi:hypothetical protein